MRTIRIALGLPWYDGPDKDCFGAFLAFQHYLGRLQERLWWSNRLPGMKDLPKLDGVAKDDEAEIPEWMHGTDLEFIISDESGISLPGMARERVIDISLRVGADYILFYDDDMLFTDKILFQLLRHEKPVVAALAFTAREPIAPVIYRFRDHQDRGTQITTHVDPILDYEPDTLQRVDAIGFGVVLIQASVFRRMPKPWFNNPGVGEDIQFCIMCKRAGIPVYVDTSAKTIHKPRYHKEWHSEEMYLRDRAADIAKAKRGEPVQ